MRSARILWFLAAVFIVSCFISGAWLGKTLSSMPPVTTGSPAVSVGADQAMINRKQRETAIATAAASPVAVLIIFLTVLIASGTITKGSATMSPRTNDRRG